jgi:Ca2+-binding EF-hand superfamily protein
MNKLALGIGGVLLASLATHSLAQPGMGITRMDQDGDGRISREEFRPPESPRGRGPMADADTDGDGVVSRAEMDAALEARIADRTAEMREHMSGMFDAMDRDGNGLVTREEMQQHAFDRLDADGDGYITEDEARDRPHGSRGERGPGTGPRPQGQRTGTR